MTKSLINYQCTDYYNVIIKCYCSGIGIGIGKEKIYQKTSPKHEYFCIYLLFFF